jgi:hypothetical protein
MRTRFITPNPLFGCGHAALRCPICFSPVGHLRHSRSNDGEELFLARPEYSEGSPVYNGRKASNTKKGNQLNSWNEEVSRMRKSFVTVALVLALAAGMASSAYAKDEFENGFKTELGAIAARSAVGLGVGLVRGAFGGPYYNGYYARPYYRPVVIYTPPPPPPPVYVETRTYYYYPAPVYVAPPPPVHHRHHHDCYH